ncbi:MAG: acyl-CoA dehydrogenase family protein [Actinomycetota bacterium]
MNFTFDDTQDALRELARRIFTEHATHDRLKQLEAGGQSFDAELWAALERAGLTTLGVESGPIEQCVVLIEQGRAVAPVPLWSHLIGSGAAGSADGVFTLALDEPGADDALAFSMRAVERDGSWSITGEKVGVPALDVAERVVVTASTPDGPAVFHTPTSGLVSERRVSTTQIPVFAVRFDQTPGEKINFDTRALAQRAIVANCAIGVGVAERALELTAAYTSERKQFDKPLGSFQAVQQRAADAYIDVQAMRWTMWQAAWRISEGLDADRDVAIAKFWAAEGGQRVVSAAQHLHGGLGSDIDYPLFRYTLWAKDIELEFGSATPTLARMGEALAR